MLVFESWGHPPGTEKQTRLQVGEKGPAAIHQAPDHEGVVLGSWNASDAGARRRDDQPRYSGHTNEPNSTKGGNSIV